MKNFRRLPYLAGKARGNADAAIRAHIEAEHGGFTAEELEELEGPNYASVFLIHHSRHGNDGRHPVAGHFHGNEGDEAILTDAQRLAYLIADATTEAELADVATEHAAGNIAGAPEVIDAVAHAFGAGLRLDALMSRIHGETYDPTASYAFHAAEQTADLAKDRHFHDLKTAPRDLDDLTVEEMRRLIELNERLLLEVSRAALHDPLTGLPNRRLFADQLDAQLARARRNGESVGVLFVDLDGFKAVNDSFGHDIGDALLVEISRRLNAGVRAGDCVARLGGDEFVIMLAGVDGEAAAQAVAEKLRGMIRELAVIEGIELTPGASIGVAVGPTDESAEELLQRADREMYAAKAKGKRQ